MFLLYPFLSPVHCMKLMCLCVIEWSFTLRVADYFIYPCFVQTDDDITKTSLSSVVVCLFVFFTILLLHFFGHFMHSILLVWMFFVVPLFFTII